MSLDKDKRVYLDFMASTPVDGSVIDAMAPLWSEVYAHPWALHKDGVKADSFIDDASEKTASFIGARSKEIVFTSGGTESTTQAIKGFLEFVEESNGGLEGLHMIMSKIEHPSVGSALEYVKEKGMEVSLIGIDENGIIDVNAVREELRPETILVSIMYANSEIGTIQPIKEIGKIIKAHRKNESNAFVLPNLDFKFPAFHTDASQASLYLDCNVENLGVDMMTLDAHKMYGPKGVGALYIRNGLLLKPLLFGHAKGDYLRKGTPPTALIVGFAKALEIAVEEREEKAKCISELRDYFIERVEKEVPIAKLNGDRVNRLPHNVSFSFDGVNHEFLTIQLDEDGISVATRSACSASKGDNSHVIEELFNHREASAIRISLGKETTKEELDYCVDSIKKRLNIV